MNCVAYSISSVAESIDWALSFSRKVYFKRKFPVAFLANGGFVTTRPGLEPATPVL